MEGRLAGRGCDIGLEWVDGGGLRCRPARGCFRDGRRDGPRSVAGGPFAADPGSLAATGWRQIGISHLHT